MLNIEEEIMSPFRLILLFGFYISTAQISAQPLELTEFSNGKKTKFSTDGHPKSMGLNITVEFPSSWSGEEGERTHIVQKFSGTAQKGTSITSMIIIDKVPAFLKLFSNDILVDVLSADSTLQEMIPAGGKFIEGGATKYDGQPGCWISYRMNMERAGMELTLYAVQHMVFYSGKMIAIQGMVGGLKSNELQLASIFQSYIPLFQQIGNSLIIHDKWEKHQATSAPSTMNTLFGEYWWLTIAVSFLLTWGIGLTPPLLLRFAIVRKPLRKRWTIPIVFVLWVINLAIFEALGSTSKTHTALTMVAFVSFFIIRKGAKEQFQKN